MPSRNAVGETPTPPLADAQVAGDPRLAELRARDAGARDPAGFRYLEALARRSRNYQGAARKLIDDKLTRALTAYAARLDAASPAAAPAGDAVPSPAATAPTPPSRPSPLADLLRELASRTAQGDASVAPAPAERAPPPELKSLDYFRDSWSRLSVEQQFAQAMAQAPENAGPLNSHLLILRALQRMREISPDYLNRFMTYADALVWLDQATGGSLPSSRPVVRTGEGAGEALRESRRKPAHPRKRKAPDNR